MFVSANWRNVCYGIFFFHVMVTSSKFRIPRTSGLINPLNAKLNPICHLLALLGAHRILHVSKLRVDNDGDRAVRKHRMRV